jgi:hypothetical protein
MANLNSESYHSLIGLLTPEYLGFLKLQIVPRFTGTGTCISPVPVNRSILTSLMMKTGLNNALLPTLFTVVNNIEQYCYTQFRLNNIVQYC